VFATKRDESIIGNSSGAESTSPCSLILCNAIGTPVDNADVEVLVNKVVINSTQVIAAGRDTFVVWSFTAFGTKNSTTSTLKQDFMAFKYDIDDVDESGIKTGTNLIERRKSSFADKLISTFVSRSEPIVCITASEKILTIGLEGGSFEIYLLPKVTPVQNFTIACQPLKIALNCDSSKLAIVENNSMALIYDMEALVGNKASPGKVLDFERKDVWAGCQMGF